MKTETVKNIRLKKFKGKVHDLKVKDVYSYNIEGLAVHNSGAGSLVLYSLGVTNIDPVKYDLSMDRFLFAEANYHARVSDFFEHVSEGLSDDIEKNVQLLNDAKDLSVVEDKGCSTGVIL